MTRVPIVLGVETSCDETSAAVLEGERDLRGHVILSQDVHEIFGGVVPELAARHHLQRIDAVVDAALSQAGVGLDDIDVFAATAGPGLIGALLVGMGWTRAAAWARDRPFVAVHHMEAHLFGPVVEDSDAEPPFVALLASGGHTLLIWVPEWGRYHLLGQTRDDAAGEAFDKVAKMLDLPYPGGPAVADLAEDGDADAFRLPRPMLSAAQTREDPGYWDVSFSGLKTAVLHTVREIHDDGVFEERRADVAASFQAAAVDVLVEKTMRAVDLTGCRRVLLGGGVAANRRLRSQMRERIGPEGRVFHASPRLSMDNGAMVARAALFRYERGDVAPPDVSASSSMPFPGLTEALPDEFIPDARTASP
ncbi:MAG TPA: tRNA (adenosine(37)-N6)-threonylcarbamoyltransferase complex transferase subunit TsaD, partial [Longimicrobiales bacterium]|nr:tRNA (adenosine(37)-N6)-threonylcarbamoyltransferase complex transferase subunit TsaD [Longimicrobiales bacterium]